MEDSHGGVRDLSEGLQPPPASSLSFWFSSTYGDMKQWSFFNI